jgi:hypothetical protein
MKSVEKEAFVPHRLAVGSPAVDRIVGHGQATFLPDGVEREPGTGKLAQELDLVLLDGAASFELATSVNGDHGVLRVEPRVALGVAGVDGVHHVSESAYLSIFHSSLAWPDWNMSRVRRQPPDGRTRHDSKDFENSCDFSALLMSPLAERPASEPAFSRA